MIYIIMKSSFSHSQYIMITGDDLFLSRDIIKGKNVFKFIVVSKTYIQSLVRGHRSQSSHFRL